MLLTSLAPGLRGRALRGRLPGLAALALLLHAGCGGDAEPAAPDDASPVDAAGDSAPSAASGAFVVSLVPAGGSVPAAYTSVLGKVYDAPMPDATVWTAVESAAGCQLLTPRVPFCSPGCGGAAVCADDGRCAPYPRALDLGRVHVVGLGSAAFDMDAIAGSYQPAAGLTLPYPPFAAGDVVRLSAPGGVLGAFSLEGRGITPLAFAQTPALAPGQPLRLTWTAPLQPAPSRIEVRLDLSHHGGSKGKIECDVADTGALELPASQVTRLLALGLAGYPTIALTRVASGTTTVGAGAIVLRVLSTVERAVAVEGLQSCTTDEQCPAGKHCRSDLTCN
jgi:hypothetical protein